MRLIDADALANELHAIYDANLIRADCPATAIYLDAINTAERTVNSAATVMQWTDTRNKLPESSEYVLCYTVLYDDFVVYYSKEHGCFFKKSFTSPEPMPVTHWMPLPPLPGESNRDNLAQRQ